MVNVSFVNYKINNINMTNRIQQNGNIQIGQNFKFGVTYLDNDTKAVATITLLAKMEEHPEQLNIELEVEGYFNLTDVTSDDDKKEAHIQCYDQLFVYASQVFSYLTQNGGLPGLSFHKIAITKDQVQVGGKERPIYKEA